MLYKASADRLCIRRLFLLQILDKMLNIILVFAALPILRALAAIEVLEPAPGDVYKPNATCSITWDADTTGKWTTMAIELMTGSNEDMVHLTSV